jgi:hypothetical protein
LNYFSVFFSLNGNDHRHLNYTTRLARRCQADWLASLHVALQEPDPTKHQIF